MEKINKSWKAEYLRILNSGISGEDDWPLAKELIDEGLATGSVLPNSRGGNPIAAIKWRGPTTAGRVFADGLAVDIKKATFAHKAKMALWVFSGWAV